MADKDKQPQQADFDKAWDNIKKGKTMPTENDMGPLPIKKPLPKSAKYAPSEELKKFDENYKKGGSVSSASKRADGIAVRGKTRA
jgi:hypothetical protein